MPNLGLRNNLIASKKGESVTAADSYHVTFDGTGDYIQLPSNYGNEAPITFVYDGDFSIAAWIYLTEVSGTSRTIFSSGITSDNLLLGVISGGQIRFTFDGQGSNNGSPLIKETWYHIVITYDDDANELKHYTDGTLVDTDTLALSSSRKITGYDARIGYHSAGSTNPMDGKIASVAIYDNLLTAGEVSSLADNSGYNANTVGSCVGWWRMGDGTEAGSGSTIYDMSDTNSNNGTLNGDAAIASGGVG